MLIERFQFYFKHSMNDLAVNKQRSIFGLFCIAAGVAVIVALLTIGVMIQKTLSSGLQESNRGDIRITPSFFSFDDEGEDLNFDERQDRLEDLGYIKDFQFTETGKNKVIEWYADYFNVSPNDNCAEDAAFCITFRQSLSEVSGIFITSFKEDEAIQRITGSFLVETDRYPLYGKVESEDGKSLAEMIDPASYTDPERATGDIVISENLAEFLEVGVGDQVRLNGVSKDLTIRGIVPTRTEAGFENILGGIFGYYYVDMAASSLFEDIEEPAYSNIYVRLDDPSLVDEVSQAFESDLESGTAYLGQTTTDDLKRQNEDLSVVVTQFVGTMGLVSMLIGGIGIVNTMLVIVRRRTNEVAVLKTLGLKPTEISTLFLVEAVLMGIVGSIVGIFLGLLLVFVVRGAAEAFLAQDLTFTIAPTPVLTGFVVGVLTTTIFGFLPTLAAGQVRPATVLRPQDTVVPQAGRARSVAALLVIIIGLSIITQGMLYDLLTSDLADDLKSIARIVIAVMGLLIGVMLLVGGDFIAWTRHLLPLRILRWMALLVGLPILGFVLGSNLPAVLVILSIFIIVGYLFVTLWFIIWAAGGGRIQDLWPGALILAFPLLWPLIPVLIVLTIPTWILGWLIQRFMFVDFKIAMRSMLATKGRGASTLVALVVGVFTLSLITMLVSTIRNVIETQLEDIAGGNLIAFVAGGNDSVDQLEDKLNSGIDGVNSYALIRTYNVELVSFRDVSSNAEPETLAQIRNRLRRERGQDVLDQFLDDLGQMDARSVDSNLPDVNFYDGHQLRHSDLGQSVIVVPANDATLEVGFEIGDELTFRFIPGENARQSQSQEVTFTIVGMTDQQTGGELEGFGTSYYVPIEFLPNGDELSVDPETLSVIIDADEDKLSRISKELLEIEGVFALETRLINDIFNRLIDQFTQLPLVVAALSLVTGGIVIANSVALSMMERRREIAIMKAVGLKRRRVLGMLLMENGLMGVIGGFIGVGISTFSLVMFLVYIFNGDLGRDVPYVTALILMGICVGIALIASVVSVWGASSEKPLNVLRYE